jgi:L-fucose isomerase-like protein
MAATRLKIGYVGSHLPSYFAREYDVFNRSITGLEGFARELDFDLQVVHEPVVSAEDARRVSRELDASGVDFVLLQNSSFAMGNVITEFARGRARLGLWGMEEPTHEGPILLNTLVSLNMNAGIITRYLKDHGLPFKWFWGHVEHPWMGPRFRVTVQALRAVKRLKTARIGWVGDLAPTFYNLAFDERKLETRLGTRIQAHELAELTERARHISDADIKQQALVLSKVARKSEVSNEHLERGSALYVAMRDFAAEYGYDALAVSCWPQFQTDLGIAPCMAYSWLNEHDGLAVSCEGDVVGALSMLMMNELNRDQSMMLDINDIDLEDQSVLMWHCGVSPARFADDEGITWKNHSTLGRKDPNAQPSGVVADLKFRPQPVTITRICNDAQQLLVMEADIVEGRTRGFEGSRGWVKNFTLNGETISLEDFVNTTMVEGIEHHFIVGRGHHGSPLLEFSAWTGMSPIQAVPYRDHLQFGSRSIRGMS